MAVFDADLEVIPNKQILTSPRFIRLFFISLIINIL
jgi:hypothetical protein